MRLVVVTKQSVMVVFPSPLVQSKGGEGGKQAVSKGCFPLPVGPARGS